MHDVDADLVPALTQLQPDLVWPLLHGDERRGRLRARRRRRCSGCASLGTGPRESRVAWSKPIAKTVVARAGLATPEFVTLPQSLFRELGARQVLDAIVDRLGLPLVVKPSRGGSALGVTLVTSADELPQAMVDCFAYSDTALVERAVIGTEVAVSVVDPATVRSRCPPSRSSPTGRTTTTPATTPAAPSTSRRPGCSDESGAAVVDGPWRRTGRSGSRRCPGPT